MANHDARDNAGLLLADAGPLPIAANVPQHEEILVADAAPHEDVDPLDAPLDVEGNCPGPLCRGLRARYMPSKYDDYDLSLILATDSDLYTVETNDPIGDDISLAC